MKKHWLINVAALALLTMNAYAADDAKGKEAATTQTQHKEWTLEDARQHAHAYADKLDKMTPEQWAEREKKRHDWAQKWKAMTPEEKEAARKHRQEWRAEKKAKDSDAKPATDKP